MESTKWYCLESYLQGKDRVNVEEWACGPCKEEEGWDELRGSIDIYIHDHV